jgi:hypothetical protein
MNIMQNQPYHKNGSKISAFSSANTMTNIISYFCHNGKTQVLENKFKGILFNRIVSKKKVINISNCINLFIETSLPYIKLKSKKSQKRRKAQKSLLVRPINRITSKRKAYMNFSSLFKVTKHSSKPLMLRLETEFESIYAYAIKQSQSQSSASSHSLMEKRDSVHKSAYKYMPRS